MRPSLMLFLMLMPVLTGCSIEVAWSFEPIIDGARGRFQIGSLPSSSHTANKPRATSMDQATQQVDIEPVMACSNPAASEQNIRRSQWAVFAVVCPIQPWEHNLL